MLHHALSVAILALASTSLANPVLDQAQFTSAANNLVSGYIPAQPLTAIAAAVASAASAAGVTGDPQSLLTSALEASPRPTWLAAAIPPAYAGQVNALESAIDALRPPPGVLLTSVGTDSAGSAVTSVHATSVPTASVVEVLTLTNSQGSTYTTEIPTVVSISTLSPSTLIYTATGTNSDGSAYTSTITSVVSALGPAPLTTVPIIITQTTTNAQGSTFTTSYATISTILHPYVPSITTSTTSTSNLAPGPSGLGRSAAAGVIALVGLAVAL